MVLIVYTLKMHKGVFYYVVDYSTIIDHFDYFAYI